MTSKYEETNQPNRVRFSGIPEKSGHYDSEKVFWSCISIQKMCYCLNNSLQSNLLILFIIFGIQFFVIFHVVNVRDELYKDARISDLLEMVKEHHRIMKIRYRDLKNVLPIDKTNGGLSMKLRHQVKEVKEQCETVHVSIVCTGYKSSRILTTLIKSLVFYRQSRLHFHLIVDVTANQILSKLFDTWKIPVLQVSFYDANRLLHEVDWIMSTHYSGLYGLMKLALDTILPKNLTKVIVLDTDLTFNADITELWRIIAQFETKQAIGLVENQSDWYLKYKSSRWPAIGRGFNTGVILFDLEKLRTSNWKNFWKTVAINYLRLYNRTQLADQDILNAVIKQAPYLIYKLPCEWNVQMSLYTKSENCYRQGNQPKVVHWNSMLKENVPNRDREFFRKLYRTFVEYDGNLIRKGVLGCTSLDLPLPLEQTQLTLIYDNSLMANSNDRCREFELAGRLIYRTHIFFLPFKEMDNTTEKDVTLVTQLSPDRITQLETLASQWTGYISAAIFASDMEAQTLLLDFVKTSVILSRRKNIAYHIVYKEEQVNSQVFYPVNYLRNVANEHVRTSFVMHIDVDFVTKMKLREYLINIINNMSLTMDSKVALVIPPFETNQHRYQLSFLRQHLLTMWDKHQIAPFRLSMWKAGQYPINYDKWRTATEPYKIDWKPYFEPYVVVSRTAPQFDSRFVGFGWNKAAYSMKLHAEKYEFIVLPDACVVHLPHSPSISNNKFRLSAIYRRCTHRLRRKFIAELQREYNMTTLAKVET